VSRRDDGPPGIAVRAPADKAVCQRALVLSALSESPVRISPWVDNRDTTSAADAVRSLGLRVDRCADDGIVVQGAGMRGFADRTGTLDFGNSATSARLWLAVAAGQPGARLTITGNDLLRRRPMSWVTRHLAAMGAGLDGAAHTLPVTVSGARRLRPLDLVPEVDSAQARSALLHAALFADGPSRIGQRCRARDHTERLLRHFGVRVPVEDDGTAVLEPPDALSASEVRVPGDVSAIAPLLAAVAIRPAGKVALTVDDVGLNPTRTGLLTVLREMGADLTIEQTGWLGQEPVGRAVIRSGAPLSGVEVSGGDLIQSGIDELPLVALLGAHAEGTTRVRDAAELRDKDTDRLAGIAALMRSFGVHIGRAAGGFTVTGPARLRPADADVGADHRMVMAAAVAASTLPEPSRVRGADSVAVSDPRFFRTLAELADVREAP
jgi:3-phosphoshikimate 1-carboxyvinyltransferase